MKISTLSQVATKSTMKHVLRSCTSFFLTLILVLAGLNSFAQTDGDYRTRSTGALNWSGTTTWQVRASAAWANTTTAPTAANSVYIQAGSSVTVDVATATCNNLNINQTSGVVTIGVNTLQASGKLRGYTGTAVFTTGADGAFYTQTASTLATPSSLTSTAGSGKLSFVGSTRSLTVTGEWGATSTGFDLDISLTAGQTGTLGTNVKAANWTMTSGILDANTRTLSADNGTTAGSVTISSGFTLISTITGNPLFQRTGSTSIATLNLNSGAIIKFGGLSPQMAVTTINFNGTVEYNRAGTQTLVVAVQGGSNPTTYNNLTLSGTSAKTLGVATTVNGTLSLQGTASLALGAFALTYGGSSILEYAGSTTQTATATEFPASGGPNSLQVNNTNNFRLPFSRTLAGDFKVLAGDVQNLSGTGITLTMSGAAPSLQVDGSITGTNVGSGNDITLTYSNTTGTLTVSGSGSLCRFLTVNLTNTGATLALARGFEVMFGTFAVNGKLQIKGGGFVSSVVNAVVPTYGASSILEYNTTSYTTTPAEFPVTGVKNVNITAPSGTNTVTLDADKTITGTFSIGTHTVNGGKSINAANITIGTGSLVAGTLTTSATFVCSGASSISMTGSWNVTGFTKSTSTVAFTGTGNLSNATSFYNLTNSGGTRSVTANFDVENTLLVSGGNITVSGGSGKSLTMSGANATINITTGSIFGTDAGAGNDLSLIISGALTTLTGNATGVNDDEKKFFNVTVNSGKTLALARGILCKYGTFTVDGTLQINANGYVNTSPAYGANAKTPAYNAVTGSLVYNNGGPYTTAGEWPAASSPANVSITNGSSVVLSADRTVANTLALANNTLTTNSNTVTVGVGGTLTRGTGYVIGNLRREIPVGPSSRTFDIGTSTGYSPVTLNFASGTGAGMLTASIFIPGAPPAAGTPPTGSGLSQTKYVNRSWVLGNNTTTTPSYSATFTYIDPTDLVGSPNTNNLKVAENNGGAWSNPGVSSSVSPTVSTVTGLSGFGAFYLGEAGCVAPTGLNYTSNTVSYCTGTAITTNSPTFTGDAATSYSVSPALPTGLNLNTSTGDITGTPTVASAAANYTVTVNNACGNTTRNVNITVNASADITLSSAPGTNTQAVCNNTAIIDITYAIGGAGTNASITSGSLPAGVTGSFGSGVFTITGTPTVAGVYNYTVTATGGVCTQNTASGTITVNAHPTATFTKHYASACGGGNDGTITVTPTSGLAPFTYSWTGPGAYTANTATITGLSSGDYTVVVTDANLCSVTIPNITIYQVPATVVHHDGGQPSSCANNGLIIIYATYGVPPYSYSLDGVTYQPGNTFTGLGPGNYTAYVKDFGNCVSTEINIILTAAAPMVVTASTTSASSCANNGSIQLFRTGGAGPYTYSLDDVTYQGSNTFLNLAGATTYTGWVKDASGCKVSLTNITVGKAPAVTIASAKSNTSACANNGYIQLTGGGGVPGYTYSLNNGAYQASGAFTGLAAGSYDGRVKDSKGCIATQFTIVVGTDPGATITVSASKTNASACANSGTIQLFRTGGTGPYTYSLDDVTYQAGNLFTGLAAGTYTGWVKDSRGCKGFLANITITAAPAVTATEGHTNSSACTNDGTIQLHAGGGVPGYTYSLDDVTYQGSNSFTGLAAGGYTGWVKDANGCKASVNITVGQNAAIVVTANAVAASNCETSNGSIQLFRTGGVGPYTYSLDNVTYQSGNLFPGKMAGTYTGYVKDALGCVGALANIFVGPNCFAKQMTITATDPVAKVSSNILSVEAYPNPTTAEFTLILKSSSRDKVVVTVTDIAGRKVYQSGTMGKEQLKFGNDLKPGIYFVQVVQGDRKQSMKLIKQ